MGAGMSGMHASISEEEIHEAFRRGYSFEERLHHARNEAGSLNRSIPWAEVTENDVLGGKGSRARDHPGSRFFRARCAFYSEDYFRTPTSRDDQLAIRLLIIDEVISTGGRFLVPCPSFRDCWTNITGNDEKLHDKIQNRMWDRERISPTSTNVDLDMHPLLDQDEFVLDASIVNEAIDIPDLNDAEWTVFRS